MCDIHQFVGQKKTCLKREEFSEKMLKNWLLKKNIYNFAAKCLEEQAFCDIV